MTYDLYTIYGESYEVIGRAGASPPRNNRAGFLYIDVSLVYFIRDVTRARAKNRPI